MGGLAMRYLLGILLILVMVTSCVSGSDRAHTLTTAATPTLDFVNLADFDRTMSATLRDRPPTHDRELPGSPPQSMTSLSVWGPGSPWLISTMAPSNWSATPESLTTRGLKLRHAGQVPGLVVSAYKLIANKLLYGPVSKYNATIFYKEHGIISKVILTTQGASSGVHSAPRELDPLRGGPRREKRS